MSIAVIGGGVVGLSILRKLAISLPSSIELFLFESSPYLGSQTTSRNSGVLHSSIYYPPSSLKESLCLRGNRLLTQYCEEHDLPLLHCGKTVVATNPSQLPYLSKLLSKTRPLLPHDSVTDLPSPSAVSSFEPNVAALAGIHFATTSVLDVPALIESLEASCLAHPNVNILTSSTVTSTSFDPFSSSWNLQIAQGSSDYTVAASSVINAAGLSAPSISPAPEPAPKHYFCAGSWWRLSSPSLQPFNGLVYPVPTPDLSGLGVHATISPNGDAVKFGPDTTWLPPATPASALGDFMNPEGSEEKKQLFVNAIANYYPEIIDLDIVPDQVGIRPKLWHPDVPSLAGSARNDFAIETNYANAPRWIDCFGIESPGLTSAMAIAEHVHDLHRKQPI